VGKLASITLPYSPLNNPHFEIIKHTSTTALAGVCMGGR